MPAGWSNDDMVVVKKAFKSASVFMQAHQGTEYYPSYAAKSGELICILKQTKEEMEGDLGDSQKVENERAAALAKL